MPKRKQVDPQKVFNDAENRVNSQFDRVSWRRALYKQYPKDTLKQDQTCHEIFYDNIREELGCSEKQVESLRAKLAEVRTQLEADLKVIGDQESNLWTTIHAVRAEAAVATEKLYDLRLAYFEKRCPKSEVTRAERALAAKRREESRLHEEVHSCEHQKSEARANALTAQSDLNRRFPLLCIFVERYDRELGRINEQRRRS